MNYDVEESEVIQILSPTAEPTGLTATRHQVHQDGLWHSTIQCWCYNLTSSSASLVMQLRSPSKKAWPNYIDALVAGHCTLNETPIETCLRELEEEVGLKVSPEELLYHSTRVVEQIDVGFINREFQHIFLLSQPIHILMTLGYNPLEISGIMMFDWDMLNELIVGKTDILKARKYTRSYQGVEEVNRDRFIPDQLPFILNLRTAVVDGNTM